MFFVSLFAMFFTALFVVFRARLVWRFWTNFRGARAEAEQRVSGKNDASRVVHAHHAASPVPRPNQFGVAFWLVRLVSEPLDF